MVETAPTILNGNGTTQQQSLPDLFVLKFADSKIPVFKESRNRDYIRYGEDNLYPDYLTYLYNKSAKHNAIITGKAQYIFGKGYENGDQIVNRNNDSLNDISKKAILDVEIYGGFRLEIIWDRAGRIGEVYHADYSCLRKAKDWGYYYKETWNINNRDIEDHIPEFDPSNPVGSQIYAYNEYRPSLRYYPLPGYIGSNNYIEVDIEISKFHLSTIRNAFMPSKLVEFISGELPDEKKKEIERRWTNKFIGSENAGKFIFATSSSKEKSINITDLSATELDKQFDILNKTCQQEIFSGHLITSPMLFGIKTEGQLGGITELKTAYEIFQNTYAKPKANAYDKEISWLMSYSRWPAEYELKQTDPIGLQFDVKDVISSIPKEFIFEKLGIPKELWGGVTQTGVPAIVPGAVPAVTAAEATPVNDTIKNLTGRQYQGIMRIVNKYDAGKLNRSAAIAMLKKGYGLDDDDVIAFLGAEEVQTVQLSFEEHSDDAIIGMFDECGDDKGDYEILKSKRVYFTSDKEMAAHEEAFKLFQPTKSEQEILDAVKINPKVTVKEISALTKTTETYINSKIRGLINEGYLEGEIGSLLVPPKIGGILDTIASNPVQIFVKYSYEGPRDNRNRPFCAKMMALNRLYSRADIEKISQKLGYSVFDRCGGFMTMPDGTVSPICRHHWQSSIVVKKGGGSK